VSKLLFFQVLVLVTVLFIYQIEDVRAAKQSRFRSSITEKKGYKRKGKAGSCLPVLVGVVSGLKWEEDIVFLAPCFSLTIYAPMIYTYVIFWIRAD
jgi:hypothetical protein